MKKYTVCYHISGHWSISEEIEVEAESAPEAYDKAFYEAIPEKEGHTPFSAWVDRVTYKNGRVHYFNTCSGLAY